MAGHGRDCFISLDGRVETNLEAERRILAFPAQQCPLDDLGVPRWRLRVGVPSGMPRTAEYTRHTK